jgi:hypothetical protein
MEKSCGVLIAISTTGLSEKGGNEHLPNSKEHFSAPASEEPQIPKHSWTLLLA